LIEGAEVKGQDWGFTRRALLAGGSAAALGALVGPSSAWAVEDRGSALDLTNATVDFALNSFANPLATGTIGGKPVHATGSLYGGAHGGPGTATGTLAGQHLAAILTLDYQAATKSGSVTTARLTASVGYETVALAGRFDLDSGFNFVKGTVAGSDRARKVDLSVSPYSWSGNTGSGAKIDGTFGSTPIAVTAKVPSGRGSVIGATTGATVNLAIRSRTQPGTHVSGTFSGPVELLAVILGTVAFFAG
jgi:hypothetical protein